MPRTPEGLKVADEVWIATALLQREQPRTADFTVRDIMRRVQEEGLGGRPRGSVHVHVISHCVANRAPSPAMHRMLLETTRGRRRLFRAGDPQHPQRRGKLRPAREDVPPRYRDLIEWYDTEYSTKTRGLEEDPLLALRGSGRSLWADEHADDYVRRLREGWT